MKNKGRLYIAHFGNKNILDRSGGVEVVVAELARRQSALGHDVTVYNRSGHHISGSEFDVPRIKEWNGVHMKYVPTIPRTGLAAVSSSFFAAIFCAFGKYDVVHIHAEGPAAFCWLPKLFGKRVVAQNHGLDHQRVRWKKLGSGFIKFGEKMSVKFSDELIVLSPEIKKYFRDTYNKETRLIPNGVNKPTIRKPQLITEKYGLKGQDYILYLSRITAEKRADLLINAFKQLKTDKKLVIAGGESGSGNYFTEIKELAKEDTRIIFTGFVNSQLLEELYSNTYLYVLPSDIEGMPLCLLEAMSYGNCCLTSDIPECTNVLSDYGKTFRQGSLTSLINEMQRLLEDSDEVGHMQNIAADYVITKYNWDNAVEQILALY